MTIMFDNPNYVDQHVGSMIRLFRKSRGLSRTQLAGRVGLDPRKLLKFERGVERISPKLLGVICTELKIRPKLLFDTLDMGIDPQTAPCRSAGQGLMR